MENAALSFNSVNKSFGKIQALKSIELRVSAGERIAVLGCNGAGKSTFLSLASGMRSVDTGEVRVFGLDPKDVETKQVIRVLPQELDFPRSLKVKEILRLVACHFQSDIDSKVVEALGLDVLLERRTFQLSGGEKRKLGLACSLIGQGQLLMLDEPTANIDLLGRNQIYSLLDDYLDENRTLVFSSHQMREVERLADRVVVLRTGEIIADGTTSEIKKKFGFKKLRFETTQDSLSVKSAYRVSKEKRKTVIYGNSSDEMLKELLFTDPKAKNIEIFEADLEEVFLKIWHDTGTHP